MKFKEWLFYEKEWIILYFSNKNISFEEVSIYTYKYLLYCILRKIWITILKTNLKKMDL